MGHAGYVFDIQLVGTKKPAKAGFFSERRERIKRL